jgi:hypothetical protein
MQPTTTESGYYINWHPVILWDGDQCDIATDGVRPGGTHPDGGQDDG